MATGWLHNLTYDIALWIFILVLEIFFREIRPRGAHRVPKQGPVIFVVAPHANQFVDPIILMRECGRRTSFLIAEKSMHQKGIGTFARMIHAIPVIRPQDLAVPGKGRIQLLNRKSEPCRITGVDTQFTQQLRPKDMIALPKNAGKAEVTEIVSDTELIIKREFKELKALELLSNDDGTPYKCMPHVEQESVYRCVHEELYKGQGITIFPEGGSHDRAELLPLKAGVTLMALGAMAKYPGLDVKIVPVGLNYFHAHRFRSRAVIEFGNPITIAPDLVDKFKQGGEQKRDACGKLLDTIHGALKSVTVNAGSYETLMLIQAARRLYKPAHRKLHISQVVDLNRRFLIGYNLFKDDPKVIELQQRVLAYNQMIKYHGLRDHQVCRVDLSGRRTLMLLLKRVFVLCILTLWAFPGGILNLPVVIVAKIISAKKASAAVKGSTVKIAGRDILATWKILVGLVLLPMLYAFYSLCMLVAVLQTDWVFDGSSCCLQQHGSCSPLFHMQVYDLVRLVMIFSDHFNLWSCHLWILMVFKHYVPIEKSCHMTLQILSMSMDPKYFLILMPNTLVVPPKRQMQHNNDLQPHVAVVSVGQWQLHQANYPRLLVDSFNKQYAWDWMTRVFSTGGALKKMAMTIHFI